nr:hypothetical protein KS05_07695 [Rhizobium brockwellii]
MDAPICQGLAHAAGRLARVMARLRPVCCGSLAALPVLLKMLVNFKRIDILIVEPPHASP